MYFIIILSKKPISNNKIDETLNNLLPLGL